MINKSALVIILMVILLASCVNDHLNVTSSKCVNSNLALTISATTNVSSCGATDGSITVSATGGVESYSFSINGGVNQSTSTFSNLAAGSYTLSVKDANGCVATQTATVNNAQSTLNVMVSTTASTGCPTVNGTLTISASGGTAPYQYKINSQAYQSSNTFTGLSAGTYSVGVLDASNCPDFSSVAILLGSPSYSVDVQPILASACYSCHNGNQLPTLSTYSDVKANASTISTQVTTKAMPLVGSLTQQQIDLINCWVNGGAPNN